MPVMDGIEACRLIHERSHSWQKPMMVFVTAHALESYEEKMYLCWCRWFPDKTLQCDNRE